MPSKKRYWLGVDLGGTKILASVVDPEFKGVASERRKTKASDGAKVGVQRLVATMEEALRQAGVRPERLAGIGVGSPGPLDLNRGVILEAPNLGWNNVPLKRLLERHFRCPAVIANDVDAGTFGEYRLGAGRKARCVVGVFPGTGIGGACVYEGRILRGETHSCMEIGHVIVDPGGALCGCGRRGCLETVASRLAIAGAAAMAVARGQAPHLLKQAGTDIQAIRSGALAASIRAGDEPIEAIVRHAAQRLGVAIAGVVNLLAPDIVVLGGGLVEAIPGIFLKEVQHAIREHAMRSLGASVKVAKATLGDEATALGAAALAAEAHRPM